ncbi:MAG: FecR domain-containing protein [Leptospirales bacterium]|nr:FecR domain-containing protein [Leptospirales bacterium]
MSQLAILTKRLPGERDDWFFVGVSILIIALFSSLLYYDFNRKRSGGSGEAIGTITFKHRVAQRKFDNQVIWDDLDMETVLYNRDSIRTADLSEAVITLKDGTKIQLDESSMIILNITDKSADINFAYGSVQAKRETKEGEEVAALNIRTQDNKVISIQNSDVKLSKTGDEDLALTVQRGEANVQTANGQTQKVEKDQKATISNEISVKKVLLRPIAPGDGSRAFITENQKTFEFSWVQPAEAVTFELATDRGFGRVISRSTLTGDRTAVALGDGSYFWRLSARDARTGAVDFSDARRFTVIRNAPSGMLSPIDGARFDYVTEEPLITFAWSKSELASGYKLEIARDAGFGNMVSSTDTSSTSIAKKLGAGTYYFRVTTVSEQAGAVSGPALSLVVGKKEKITPPQPLRPAGERIGRVLLEKEGLPFAWNTNRDIRSTQLQISTTENFSNTVYSGSSETNFLNVKQSLKEGRYFWRLQGLDRSGNPTDYSATQSFFVTEAEKIALRSPGNAQDFDPAQIRQDGVLLSWDGPDLSQFRILVSPNQTLNPAILSEVTATRARNLKNLTPGRYYWKVVLLSQNGGVLTESETRSFSILDLIQAPTLLEPPRGQTVDMTDKNELYFRWAAVNGAEGYDFTLYRNAPEGRRPVINLKTQRPEFLLRDLGVLDIGAFSWTVNAYGKNQISELSVSDFNITLRMDVGKPEVVTPGVLYTE